MSKLLQQLAERAPVVSSDGKVIYNSLKGFTISARYGNEGTFTEPIFDWGFGITKPYAVTYEADFRQPVWPQGKGYGKIPDLEIDGKPIPLNTVWPVFNGNEMSLKNSILKIRIDNKEYNPESN